MDSFDITDMKVVPCINSNFVAPSRVTFKQNGIQRTWDYIKVHDSVAVLIFNTTRQAFILVKQFRPEVYMNFNSKANNEVTSKDIKEGEIIKISAPYESGVTYELCAGIVDENRPLIGIVENEILEETGYRVPIDKIEQLFVHRGIGCIGNFCTIFYAEVTDEMKVSEGGGLHNLGEFTEMFILPLHEAKEFAFNDNLCKPSGVIAALLWFFINKEVNFKS